MSGSSVVRRFVFSLLVVANAIACGGRDPAADGQAQDITAAPATLEAQLKLFSKSAQSVGKLPAVERTRLGKEIADDASITKETLPSTDSTVGKWMTKLREATDAEITLLDAKGDAAGIAAFKKAQGEAKGFTLALPKGEAKVVARTWVFSDDSSRFVTSLLQIVEPSPASVYGPPFIEARQFVWNLKGRDQVSVSQAKDFVLSADGKRSFARDISKELGAVFDKKTLQDLGARQSFDRSRQVASAEDPLSSGTSVAVVPNLMLHEEGFLSGLLSFGIKTLFGINIECNVAGQVVNGVASTLAGGLIDAVDPLTGALLDIGINALSCAAGSIIDPPPSVQDDLTSP
jgi:hypothetical protein